MAKKMPMSMRPRGARHEMAESPEFEKGEQEAMSMNYGKAKAKKTKRGFRGKKSKSY